MRIPPFWAKESMTADAPGGARWPLVCWRWSDHSVEEARRLAREALERLARKLRSGERLERYGYDDRPMREEITASLANAAGEQIAVVTRNAYGALVLNAANVMFMDIDQAPDGAGDSLKAAVGKLFGRKVPKAEDRQLAAIEEQAGQRPELGLRVYRTCAGWRCIVVNQLFDAASDAARELLEAFGCDPLYVRLCRKQECFRARLTPKHWRCGIERPPARYPFDNGEQERKQRQWEARYAQTAARYAVCRLVREIGDQEPHPDARVILQAHDELCCGGAGERRLA